MFATETLARFRDRMGVVLTHDLRIEGELSFELASGAAEMVAFGGVDAFGLVRARLHPWRIDTQWLRLLHEERSRAIADWVAPYVLGTVLEVSWGDGRVGERLAEMGSPVISARRTHAEGAERGTPQITVQGGAADAPLPACDTVLLCSVLHRESEPDALLDMLAKTTASRMVLVENIVEPDCPPELHQLMDLFFHRCLTGASLPPAGRPRTIEEWMAPHICRGRIAAVERAEALPGVPLAHGLIVVDRDVGGRTAVWPGVSSRRFRS